MLIPTKMNDGYSRGLHSNVFGISSLNFLKLVGTAAMVSSTYTSNRPCIDFLFM